MVYQKKVTTGTPQTINFQIGRIDTEASEEGSHR